MTLEAAEQIRFGIIGAAEELSMGLLAFSIAVVIAALILA